MRETITMTSNDQRPAATTRRAAAALRYGDGMRRGATESRVHRALQSTLVGGLVAAACLVLAGCNAITQTPFQQMTREAAGTLAAAAETLTAVQEGRLNEGYARASFVSFAEAVQGVGEELTSMDGAPETETTEHLAQELQEVERLLGAPCLQISGCDASAQIRQLKALSQDLLQASEP
jgi:hypothetical protein